MIPEAMSHVVRRTVRNMEVIRKGLVTAVDTGVSPYLCTIEGRQMPWIGDTIAVGDIVAWADQADPFAWGRPLIPSTPPVILGGGVGGNWAPEGYQIDGIWLAHPDLLFSVYPNGFPLVTIPVPRISHGAAQWTHAAMITAVAFMVGHEGVVEGFEPYPSTDLSPGISAPDIAVPSGYSLDLLELGGAFSLASFTADVGAHDTPGIYPVLGGYRSTSYSPDGLFPITWVPQNRAEASFIILDRPGIAARAIASGTSTAGGGSKAYWPTIHATGAGQLLVFICQIAPTGPVGGSDQNLTIGHDGGGAGPAWRVSGITATTWGVAAIGDNLLGWWWSSGAGDYTPWVQVDGGSRLLALSSYRLA